MKILTLVFVSLPGLQACNNNNSSAEKNPADVHPLSEANPDSMKLVNDSAIMPM